MVGHKGMILSMEFSPEGNILASAAGDNTVHLWDVKSQEILGLLEGHSSQVNQIAFNPDGTLLASASEDETIILWDVASQTPVGTPLDGHRSTIYTLAFNHDGTVLASGSESDGILFWDVATGEPLGYPYQGHINNSVQDVAFSSDGSYFVSGNEKIIFWNPKPKREDWFDRACNLAGRNFTQEEWQTYLGDLPYEATCPQFPSG